jgi:hypothetical protein
LYAVAVLIAIGVSFNATHHAVHQAAVATHILRVTPGQSNKNFEKLPAGPVGPKPANRVQPGLREWDQYCYSLPGEYGPEWAINGIHDEYLGVGGIGAVKGGCTGVVYMPPWGRRRFVYTIGTLPHHQRAMSLTADSQHFGPAIFLDTAVTTVQNLINEHLMVGGSGPIRAGNGQTYLVNTTVGQMILTRPENHFTGKVELLPFALLRPAAAAALFMAMQRVGHWLWPRPTIHRPAGVLAYRLSTLGFGDAYEGEIIYVPATGKATLMMDGRFIARFGPAGIYISDNDLAHYAATAQ